MILMIENAAMLSYARFDPSLEDMVLRSFPASNKGIIQFFEFHSKKISSKARGYDNICLKKKDTKENLRVLFF